MVNEAGIAVVRRGLGREGQRILTYSEPGARFEGEVWAFRNDEPGQASSELPDDTWAIYLGAQFWNCPAEFADTAAMHVAECLLNWPADRAWNSSPATSVQIREPKEGNKVRRVITRADVRGADHG